MKKKLIVAFNELLSSTKKIIIIPHKNPDGDAIGSTLSLNFFLNKIGHRSQIISPNHYPDFLKWMPGQEEIIKFSDEEKKSKTLIQSADLIFTLDFNNLSRIDELELFVKNSKAIKIMIDHHENPANYAQITYSDSSIGSTCEMIFNLICELNKDLIDEKIATCLYTGIMTDSGSFRFPSTTAKTHQIISKLIEKGANHSEIHQHIYDSYTFNRMQLLGTALKNLKKIDSLPVIYMTLSHEELNENDFKKGDTEGFVNYGLNLKGILFAVIMIENQQDKIIKMSFRSKGGFDVNQFAKTYFNGGGHLNAAGGVSGLSLKETESKFLSVLDKIKIKLNA